jgi:hypothetical protein
MLLVWNCWGHIRFFGDGCWRFRSYSDSLFQTPKSKQKALPLHSVPRCGSACPHSGIAPGGPPPSAIHGRGRLPRHPCRGSPCATPAFGLWERGRQIKIKSQSQSQINSSRHPLIVPTLCVGMHPVTLRVPPAQDSSRASTAERGASPAAFPRGAWERSTINTRRR